ncbi:uncharacterized protein LOC136087681 [Hydra vulgaris]|uniref:Uncharacterized protein LOC136087681 n=1 Tax=Hydra vulgaris TaxID=6087 RepID=A0ABM4CZ03_HYDVU
MQFTSHNKSMRVPFVVYAEFESFIKQIDTCEPNPNESYTKQYQKHIPSSSCYYIKCFNESFYQSSPVTVAASSETDDVAQIFVDSLQEDIIKICGMIKFPKKMIFTTENKHDFNAATECHICGEKLGKDKVRDHCHITGKLKVRFNETQLPPKESFFSKLNDEDISDNDYSHAQNVWNEFNCKTLRDYHDLDVCMKCYKLDPAWYCTSPGLAWDAALKKTKIKLELLSDYDMILMIKKGIRGGISMISNRLGTSNNKYIGGELGLKITKIHRGIKFEERAWLNENIELNTNLRTKATNDFKKDFFKLMNNSVFGKTMENFENRVDIRLVTDRNEAIKLASKPNFESRTIFDENLIAIHMKRTELKYAKPIYLGMCILDLSKTLIYRSLAYETKTEDFYSDISKDIESKFDTSEFNPKHPAINNVGFKVGVNKKVIGMFKDKTGGAQIEEFVRLRSKLYSYKVHGKDNKKCKGVKKNVVKKYITHEDYKYCLLSKRNYIRKMNVIRSHLHEIYTEEINKIALSAEDYKRVILEDGIHTLAYGHYKLKENDI